MPDERDLHRPEREPDPRDPVDDAQDERVPLDAADDAPDAPMPTDEAASADEAFSPTPTGAYLASQFAADAETGQPPRAEDGAMPEEMPQPAPRVEREPLPSEEDTEDIPAITDDDLARLDTERPRQPEQLDRHELPTMPVPFEMNPTDPKRTLQGSEGFDPNPDFADDPNHPEYGHTVPHIVPFQHTMVHVPPEKDAPTRQPPPPPPPMPTQQNAGAQRPGMTQQGQGYGGTVQRPAGPYAPQYPQQGPAAPVPGQSNLPARRGPRRRRILGCTPGCAWAFIGLFVTFCGGLTLITLVLTATLGARLEEQLQAQVASVDDYRNFESTFYYDRNGEQLYEAFGEGRRTNVNFADFPPELIYATVAIEDDNFWTNPGFEIPATARAFLQYVGLAEGASGGSTITQQLVRNVLFDYEYRTERSIQRKVEEILLSVLLTNRKSKQEILELYLNEIYYGNLAYGAEAAAQTLFGKSAGELTLGEAALLAALPQAPASLDPLNPDPAVQEAVAARWRLVLDRMVQERYITTEQRDQALRDGYQFNPPEAPLRAPHFTVYAQQQFEALMTRLGHTPEDVARGGWQVYTTVDLAMNQMAQQSAQSQVAALAANNVSNAAVLVMKPMTGEILAMVGSVDYNNEAIDGNVNVTISPRQPGSTMKPFTYAAAMEMGFTPADVIWDTPTDIAGYAPRNYDNSFHGPVRLRLALASSYNIPAVQTLRSVGVDNLLAFMQRLGVQSLGADASQYGLSLTLGGGEMTLLELTRAYAVFANGGVYVPSTAILCVLDGNDNIVYEYEDSCPKGNTTPNTVSEAGYGQLVLDPRIAYIISDVLADNNARAPGMGANSPLRTDIGASVKTGTTNDIKDNWTVGYTRNVAVGVWVGNSRGEPMVNSSGLTGAAPIWNSVINAIHNDQSMMHDLAVEGQLQPNQPDMPQGLSRQNLCDLAALRDPATGCPSTVAEWMLDGPAGIPDGAGGLQFPPQPPPADNQPPPAGPWLKEIQPDIYQVLVQPLPPEIGNQIQFTVGAGQTPPPAPIYCQVPIEAQSVAPGAQEQVFIGPPPDPEDAVKAEQWARSQGLAFLPTIACDAGLLSLAPGSAPIVITAQIQSPTPGQVISGGMPIIGTVQFSPDQALYYKIEISGGQFGGNWVTLGDTHGNSVVNDQLEYLAALPPSNYQIRLVVVGHDGNFVQPPYTVPFTVQ